MITITEKKKLKKYLQIKIPPLFKILDNEYSKKLNKDGEIEIDLMYSYEEIFHYSHLLLDGVQISENRNFIGVAASIFRVGFFDKMLKLGETYPELDNFVTETISVTQIIKKHAK